MKKLKIACCWLAEVMGAKNSCPSYEQVHYFDTLKRMGHDVKIIPIQPMEDMDSVLIDSIEMWKPDILFVKFYRTEIRKETIKYISDNTDTITVGLFGDDEKVFKRSKLKLGKGETTYSAEVAPSFNWVVTTYKPAVKWYKKLGIKNVFHSHYGANHWAYKKLKLKKIFDVSFCGARKSERSSFLNRLAASGIKLHVFGNGWDGDKSVLDQSDYSALFCRSKININIGVDLWDGKKVLQIKGRDWEVPMSGGFLMNHYNPLMEENFKQGGQGKEIGVYKNTDDLVKKIKYYLAHDKEREKIALAGYRRARKDHTYKKRFERILDIVKH